jgi:hypothetical protein
MNFLLKTIPIFLAIFLLIGTAYAIPGQNGTENSTQEPIVGGTRMYIDGGYTVYELDNSSGGIKGYKSCTLEAKICPDGSYVGRNINRDCEFDACPGDNESNAANETIDNRSDANNKGSQPAGEDFFSGIILFIKNLLGLK